MTDTATTNRRRRQGRRPTITAAGLALRHTDSAHKLTVSPAVSMSAVDTTQSRRLSNHSSVTGQFQRLTSGGNQQHAEFTQCRQYRLDVSFDDCLSANRNVATTITQVTKPILDGFSYPGWLQLFNNSSLTNCTAEHYQTTNFNLKYKCVSYADEAQSEISLRKHKTRFRHHVAVYARAS